MPAVDFYFMPGSAPCRSVRLTAKAAGVDLNLKPLDLMKGEHLTADYIKLNPQHTIPTIHDNGFSLWESRAIQGYLADKYAKDDSLYPKDAAKRAVVNQRLFFDIGTLYQRFGDYVYPMMFGGAPKDADKLKKLEDALAFLDFFLESSKWAAGDHLTIADHSLVSTVSTIEATGVVDLSKYANVSRWFSAAKSSIEGYEELNGAGAAGFGDWYHSIVKD